MQWGDGIPRDGTSRKMREYQIRFCEKLSVKFTGLTRQFPGPTRHGRLSRQRVRYGRSALSCGRAIAAQQIGEECQWH